MIKKNILIIVVLYSLLISCITVDVNHSIYKRAEEIIKNNDMVIKYTNNQLKADEVRIFVSEEKVPFNLSALEVSIIKNDYLKDFNEFGSHNKNEESIIKRVTDSLYRRDLYLNKGFNTKESKNILAQENMKKYNYILFFSDIKDGQIFAKLIPYNYEISKSISSREVSFGTGFSFLFNIETHKIVKTYYDKVIFN